MANIVVNTPINNMVSVAADLQKFELPNMLILLEGLVSLCKYYSSIY